MLGTRREDKYSDFALDKRHFESYLRDEEYLSLAEKVLSEVGLQTIKEDNQVKIRFKHSYPQYVYTRLASSIEKEIKHLL
jgi:hypothetical protein